MGTFVVDTTHDIINLFTDLSNKIRYNRLPAACVLDKYITLECKNEKRLCPLLASAAAEFIEKNLEFEKVCQFLSDFDLSEDEKKKVYGKMKEHTENCRIRRSILYKLISDHLKGSGQLLIDGLVNFKFKEYTKLLRHDTEEGFDSYLTEKAYKEFLDLLKYFISLGDCGVDTVHVFKEDFGYVLTDKNGIITDDTSCVDLLKNDDRPLTPEDFLIGKLIGLSPGQIIIHDKIEDKIKHTLDYVFDGRIIYS